MKQIRRLGMAILVLTGTFGSANAHAGEVRAKVDLFPAGSFEAYSSALEGKLVRKDGRLTADELRVPVASLTTKINLRDEHLREKLGPKSMIIARNVEVKEDKGTAQLTMGEVTKDIAFKVTKVEKNRAYAGFSIHLPDFKISGINYKGVGVEDNVELTTTVDVLEL